MPEPVLLTVVDAALRGTLLAWLLLLAAVLLRDRPRLPAARVGMLMLLGLCVQVVSSTPLFEAHVARLWQAPLVGISVANGVLFWVFVQALFQDEFRVRPLHWALWLGVASLGTFNCATAGGASLAMVALQRAVPFVFAGLTALAAASRWRDDLVESRRRLRAFIVVSGVAYTLLMLAVRLISPQGRLSGAAATFDVLLLLAMIGVVAWRMLRLTASELFPNMAAPAPAAEAPATAPETSAPAAAPDTPPTPDPAEERLAAALQRLMSVEHVYRSEALSVASLAARLAVPEYRLRHLINRRLGHRNFNAFVNGFRLAEARAVLADPVRRELPVLTIALEAGFQSIGPFNRAFKAATGLTPTEFRRRHSADS